MEEKVLEILQSMHPEVDFQKSNAFIEDELIDSFDMIELVDQIETKFDITIDGMDIVMKHFNSLEAICNLIRKSGGV